MNMRTLHWIPCLSLFLMISCSTGDQTLPAEESITRYGSVIRVKPGMLEEYKALHAEPWAGVNRMLKEVHIRNYSIYYRDGYLFSYFEYTGTDFESDMARMAADSLTREWWKLTDPCQLRVETAAEGEWWAPMEEVYHLD